MIGARPASLTRSVAQTNPTEIYFVDDAASQFNQLALARTFGFGSPDDFDPTFLDCHYEDIVRKQGPGVPYLFVSRNRDGAGDITYRRSTPMPTIRATSDTQRVNVSEETP